MNTGYVKLISQASNNFIKSETRARLWENINVTQMGNKVTIVTLKLIKCEK